MGRRRPSREGEGTPHHHRRVACFRQGPQTGLPGNRPTAHLRLLRPERCRAWRINLRRFAPGKRGQQGLWLYMIISQPKRLWSWPSPYLHRTDSKSVFDVQTLFCFDSTPSSKKIRLWVKDFLVKASSGSDLKMLRGIKKFCIGRTHAASEIRDRDSKQPKRWYQSSLRIGCHLCKCTPPIRLSFCRSSDDPGERARIWERGQRLQTRKVFERHMLGTSFILKHKSW